MSSTPPPSKKPKLDLPRRGGTQFGAWVECVEVQHNGRNRTHIEAGKKEEEKARKGRRRIKG
jgi:hypothetical protein